MANILDTALDRSVVGGFSRLGFAVRKRFWPDDDPSLQALAGATVVVTGATSGIGAAIADGVVGFGGRAVLVGRNGDRAAEVRDGIEERHPGASVDVELADISDPDQVRDLASRLSQGGVDSIVHNAGVLPKEWTASAGGHELALATNVLGPLQLTELLLPQLSASDDPRVVFMSSGGMYTASLPVGDIEFRDGEYNGTRAYARTKRIQTALLPILADRWGAAGVMVAAMHPGWVKTPGIEDSLPGFSKFVGPLLRTAAEGADTAVWLVATAPTPPTGRFWEDRQIRPEHYLARTEFSEAERRSVWDQVRAAAGIGREPQ